MTAPMAAVLMTALIASHAPCMPNIRFTPGSGLSFFSVGLMPFAVSVTPPWATEATVPTSIMPSASGSTAPRKALSACPMSTDSWAGSGWSTTNPTCRNSSWTAVNALPTSIGSSTLAAAAPTQVPSSWVRGICPSLRACLIRFGVGFSVFSPPGPSFAISPAPERGHRLDRVVHERVEGGGEQREGQAQQHQGDHDLDRKADREDVERGRGAGQQRQGDVGEQQHGDHRPGDLQRRKEHHGERRDQRLPDLVGGD